MNMDACKGRHHTRKSADKTFRTSMDAILNPEQEELLKRTRDTLGRLRDLLGDTAASKQDPTALNDSIPQLDD
jgi:hypothetical protein